MSARIPVKQAQRTLALVWVSGFALMFVGLLGLTITERFGSKMSDVWQWFWAALVPTLTLIIGAVGYEWKHPRRSGAVDRSVYAIALGLSVIYVMAVAAAIFTAPLIRTLALIQSSPVWLQPLQGLLGLSLGAFFVAQKSDG